MMAEVIRELQGITELPLQIDTSNTEAMARAMRVYNGKPLLNSVNGKQEVMDAVFPLVKRYGAVVVALTLDESGIPETADGRIAIAEKIYREAAKYGIGKKDILIDALCMTISSDRLGALTTLETVKRVRQEMGWQDHTWRIQYIIRTACKRKYQRQFFSRWQLYNGF